jgi:hypothetical protein
VNAVAAVVVAWNGGAAVERCLASLRTQGVFRVILVDNGSRDAERSRLQRLFGGRPEMQLILLQENRGFAEGANIGLRAALDAGAQSILVATQDVILAPEAVAELATALRAGGAGIAGPLVLDLSSGRELSRGERLIPAWICLPRTLLRHRRADNEPFEVSGVMGCLLLLSADCARATGGFDPSFFAYYEEVDLCLRARAAGFRILCVPAARVWHDGLRGFLGGFTPLAAELKARNLVWLMRRHGSPARWLAFLPTYLLLVAASALLYLVQGRVEIAAALGRGAMAGIAGG